MQGFGLAKQRMKTINDHLYWGKKYLDEKKIPDANLSAKILLSYATKIPSIQFIKEPQVELDFEVSSRFKDLIERRGQDQPVSYLTGEKEFYSLRFEVDSNVLIPRPETETLIDWFGEKIGNKNYAVCDVGTGSGAIAITLKKAFPKLHMAAVDISEKALEVAKKNAINHRAEIDFAQSDLLTKVTRSFEVIVANLPYIPAGEIDDLAKTVQFEPKIALASGMDGLDHYRRLLPMAYRSLRPQGCVFFEFGKGQKNALVALLEKNSFLNIEVRADLAGIDRVVFARRS